MNNSRFYWVLGAIFFFIQFTALLRADIFSGGMSEEEGAVPIYTTRKFAPSDFT